MYGESRMLKDLIVPNNIIIYLFIVVCGIHGERSID